MQERSSQIFRKCFAFRQAGVVGQDRGTKFSTSVSYQNCEHDISKTNEPILMKNGTSGPRGSDIKLSDLGIKGQGHIRPNTDLETWRKHHSQPLGSSSFYSLQMWATQNWWTGKNVSFYRASAYWRAILFACLLRQLGCSYLVFIVVLFVVLSETTFTDL